MTPISEPVSAVLSCQREIFSIPQHISYLNCAYMAPLAKPVEQAGIQGVQRKSQPYEITANDFFEPLDKLKRQFSDLIHNGDAERIAFQPSASYGMATVVKNLPIKKRGNIVLVRDQFPSNVLAYQELADMHDLEIRFIDPPVSFENRSARWNEKILDAIDTHTICVGCPHIHWADGTIFELAELRTATSDHDALLVIDGTQSVGALPFSIETVQPDALICAGYKFLLGPYSCALTYFSSRFDGGEPLEYNWIARKDSDQFGGLVNYQQEYRPKAFRFNVGECSNFIAIPMLCESINLLMKWGVEAIQSYCQQLVAEPIEEMRSLGYSIAESGRANHLFGLYLPSHQATDMLQQRLQESGIYVSVRGSSIRVSPHVYNDAEDLQKLTACLKEHR